jgi:hypothetical protein
MIEPATDEEIESLGECLLVGQSHVLSLIARIKAERDASEVWEARVQSVLETNSVIREQTVRECAALADKLNEDFLSQGYAFVQPSGSFLERFAVDEYRIAILALLTNKGEQR